MKNARFQQLLASGPVLLDGATGTQLQAAGLPTGTCPEIWVLEHPEVLNRLQMQYLEAGSSILYAFTFGANRIKLAGHLQQDIPVATFNRQLAELTIRTRDAYSRHNPDRIVLVAGDLSPTGQFLRPAGDLEFSDLVAIYRSQVIGQLAAGVDLFVIETMMDLAQTRAAVFAVRELCDLPVMASMTLAENGRTLSGDAPLSALITLASLGVDVFGLNCSFGPDRLSELILPLVAVSPVPLLVKPNAGMPQLIDGQTVFPMAAAAFAAAMKPLAEAGVALLGGCCGTGPDHIAALKKAVDVSVRKDAVLRRPSDCGRRICSSRQCIEWNSQTAVAVLPVTDPDNLIGQAMDCLDEEPDAVLLDCSAFPASQSDQLADLLQELQMVLTVPLVFQCDQPILLETLLRHYHGRAGIRTNLTNAAYGALPV